MDVVKNDADFYILNNNIIYDCNNLDNSFKEKKYLQTGYINREQACEWIVGGKAGALWDKIYKSDILKKLDISAKIMYGDDVYINLNYLAYVNRIYCLDSSVYCHVMNSQTSVCSSYKGTKKLEDLNVLYVEGKKIISKHEFNRNVLQVFEEVISSNLAKEVADLIKHKMKKEEIKANISCMEIFQDPLYQHH